MAESFIVEHSRITAHQIRVDAKDCADAMKKALAFEDSEWEERKTETITAKPALETRRGGIEVTQ